MKFSIYQVKNGFLLNVRRGDKTTSYVFKSEERITMLTMIDKMLGPDPGENDEQESEEESSQA